jgi:predicted transcriptional regulator
MNITFDELRKIKHQLPTGSVSRIASELNIEEQTVRNYFGAKKFENGEVVGCHIEPGPNGGIVHLDDDHILHLAKKILAEAQSIAS